MEKKLLSVRLQGEPIGILEQTLTGKMMFTYSDSATQAISLSMPLRTEPYLDPQCEAYFGGLLPESETVKKAIGRRYGVNPNNSFALLRAIGYDCAGAVSFVEMNTLVTPQQFFPLEGKIVSNHDLYHHILELPQKPLFLGLDGLRLSLAGVQDKAAVCLIGDQVALPIHGCPTTHILKPAIPKYDGIIENEYFCLRIAKAIGLVVPDVKIQQINDIRFLLIERFDRHVQNNQVTRIHQEDFCQALGIVSARKYQAEGGPSIADGFNLLTNTTQPAIDRNRLAAAIVYNYLICNMDAHGKNFSLLHKNPAQVGMAPLYDIVCTQVYPELTAKMAMKIGGKYELNYIYPRHWQRLCNDCDYAYPALRQLINKQGEAILKAAEIEKQHLIQLGQYSPIIDKIIELLTQHINHTLELINA
jgi:serine/threonine-protein kinase HipA